MELSEKSRKSEARNDFYLSFFDDKKEYEEKEINGFWLVRTFNPVTNKCQVMLYTRESFKAYKEFQKTKLFP